MAILSTVQKIRPYIKTLNGYVKLKLFSDDIVTDKGTTVQEELNTINTNLSNLSTKNYIVEERTTNLGTYRKWSNGVLEMWGMVQADAGTYIGTWGSPPYYCYKKRLPLPLASKTVPIFNIQLKSNAYNYISIEAVDVLDEMRFWISLSSKVTVVTFMYHAKGTWK